MTREPVISVVMAVCNGARTLERSVKSILRQTFDDFEFLIIDDGSRDETLELLKSYSHLDGRIRVMTQTNTGLTQALINGCGSARGQWIARQDSDDWSDPHRFEKCLVLANQHPDCTMLSSWVNYLGPGGEFLDVIRRPVDIHAATEELLYRGLGPPAHGSLIFRRVDFEQAGGYRPEFYFAQDSDLWLRMGWSGKIGYVQEVLYHHTLSPDALSGCHATVQRQFGDLGYRCHTARMTGEMEGPFLAKAAALTATLRAKALSSSFREKAAANYRIGVRLARRKDPSALGYFYEAFRLNPFHWRALLRWISGLLQK